MLIIKVSGQDENGKDITENSKVVPGHAIRIVEVFYEGEPGQAASEVWESLPTGGDHWIVFKGKLIATK